VQSRKRTTISEDEILGVLARMIKQRENRGHIRHRRPAGTARPGEITVIREFMPQPFRDETKAAVQRLSEHQRPP
jgi:uncharacterized protein YqeY